MCGRYALYAPSSAIRRAFGVRELAELTPRYNIAPGQAVPVIRMEGDEGPRLDLFRWGLVPSWAEDPAIGHRLINARVETVAQKPAFRAAFRRRRCLLPASGFYEWKAADAGPKVPYFIRGRGVPVLALAGLWEHHAGADGELRTCTILTTEAQGPMRDVHGRMPLIIRPERYAQWLDPARDAGASLAACTAAGMPALELWPVSRAVNSPRNDGSDLIRPQEDV